MAQRVLAYASNLTLANKARFLSFFAGGCPQTSRIARWLAHAILLGAAAPPYSGLPPLEPLKNLLSSPAQIGEICSDTDYDELCCRIDILAVALTGIDEYVAEERRLARLEKVAQYSTSPASPGRLTREKLPTPLEAIRMALDSLNGRIGELIWHGSS